MVATALARTSALVTVWLFAALGAGATPPAVTPIVNSLHAPADAAAAARYSQNCASEDMRNHAACTDGAVRREAEAEAEAEEEEAFIEPICREDEGRFVLFPIQQPKLWQMYDRSPYPYP